MSDEKKYVSRGGLKLEHAIKEFGVDVGNKIILDVGSSTGGFVDCLLQNNAKKVYSLDTAYGELAWTLRKDPRVVVMERTNIVDLSELPENVDFVTIDVTFTSLSRIMPIVKRFMKPGGKIIALLKPQYEDSQLALKHHGIIPEISQKEVVDSIRFKIMDLGFKILKETDSPILGGNGNREYLLYISI